MIYTRRYIDVTFDGTGSTPSLGTMKLTKHRVTASISIVGQPGMGSAQVSIYGMTLDKMNQLATFGQPIQPQRKITMIVEAGDDVNGMSRVFEGGVQQAWADFQAMPDVPFHVFAYSDGIPAQQRSEGGSQDYNGYSGATDVPKMVEKIAGICGLQFENGGVDCKLMNPYHFGSPLRQLHAIREAADIMSVIELGTLAIWPINQARPGGNLVISKDTGMVSEPSFTEYGVLVKTEFTRYAKYGTEFKIQSIITPANGPWSIAKADYDLQSLVPKGHWFVTLFGTKPNQMTPYYTTF